MPIYEYSCTQCGATIEQIQRFDDPPLVCGCGHVMNKLISTSNFHLKGSGWYVTDYKTKTDGDKSKEAPKDSSASIS